MFHFYKIFHFIILRDSIHFELSQEKRLEILGLCYDRLDTKGCIYIKISGKNHSYATDNPKKAETFSKEDIMNEIQKSKFEFLCEPKETQFLIKEGKEVSESWQFLLKKGA